MLNLVYRCGEWLKRVIDIAQYVHIYMHNLKKKTSLQLHLQLNTCTFIQTYNLMTEIFSIFSIITTNIIIINCFIIYRLTFLEVAQERTSSIVVINTEHDAVHEFQGQGKTLE